ncbi:MULTISPECIES: histidine kinase [unclassified Streptomyces]|uniref:sensor histidine kinase n=1 Tax=unclassified Streptomyces TaxID=2593676 RepID=UPI002DDB3AC6|nr:MULTISPECIES: histidine kinase [unclassified Streptomyces]WSA93911.1 histidine kinase [Streptomyces sp. NBC_01795]WSB78282.1 histidine kinase [Streptomyces sp. NBC_01775]WSS13461.1 histidine kinase [Streptomyces sp. NBC_01186]WSS42260.1 histidine kinase [Streptomyces sp. NBC_01187]
MTSTHHSPHTQRRLLPGELTAFGPHPRTRRSVRDWAVDVTVFCWALLWWAALYDGVADKTYLPDWLLQMDAPLGAVGCLSLWLRRRWPLGVAMAVLPAAVLTDTVGGALMVIVFNLALRVPPRTAMAVLLLHLGATLPFVFFVATLTKDRWFITTLVLALYLISFAWGSVARARRQLVLKLREDAIRARADHERRLADVRRAERRAIAREMHDVLAHRVSLLSVHAGALAYRTKQSAAGEGSALDDAEIAESATVIRDNAHQALEELREVLHVLREDEDEQAAAAPPEAVDATGGVRPQPGLARIGALVDEARAAGQTVQLDLGLDGGPPDAEDAHPLRPQLQRTVYRAVQEGLTNARKHAPGARVHVDLTGTPGEGLTVRVSNPLPTDVAASGIPGAGAGLTGLRERLEIEGGTLQHGTTEGTFTLHARLPWPI